MGTATHYHTVLLATLKIEVRSITDGDCDVFKKVFIISMIIEVRSITDGDCDADYPYRHCTFLH